MNNKEKIGFTLGLLIVLVMSLILANSVLGVRVDRVIRDTVTDTHARDETVLVGIDDASLAQIGAWPWKRDVFAHALDTLYKHGARLVVFDILFLENREGDKTLNASLSDIGQPVVFASKFDQSGTLLTSVYNKNKYARAGVAHVYPDDDGKVRTIPLFQKDSLGNCFPSLSYEAFILYAQQEIPENEACDTNKKMFLYQSSPPLTLSFGNVLRNEIQENAIRGKVVFIGSNTLDIEDHFVGQHGEKIPGLYVHTSVFSTLLNNSFLTPLPLIFIAIIMVVSLIFSLCITLRVKRALTQGILIVCGGLFLVVLTLFIFSLHIYLSLSIIIFPYILVSIYSLMYRYTMAEKKNNFIKKLFGHYVHPNVLSTILKDNDLRLGGERKYITILFCDIRGFTTMTENMTPEELVLTLNTYLETMSPIIMNREGVIDKYIGDAIMAFWNAPVEVVHHEEKAVRSALAMVEALTTLQTTTPLAIGIGLHAGEVIVGNIGSRTRINYTIIGDAVNACSRLEGLTKKYGLQIIVSEQIKKAIHTDDILWRSVDRVRVKGKSEIMMLFEPVLRSKEGERRLELSEKAFALYCGGKFQEAKLAYTTIGDAYSMKMVERLEHLLKTSNSSWTGVWDWDEK